MASSRGPRPKPKKPTSTLARQKLGKGWDIVLGPFYFETGPTQSPTQPLRMHVLSSTCDSKFSIKYTYSPISFITTLQFIIILQ